jgi:uncharacterized protein YndB with AHSA1/START domain
MRGAQALPYPNRGTYEEVMEPGRVAFTATLDDGRGRPVLATRTVVALAEFGDRTRLTTQSVVVWATPEMAASLDAADEGWSQGLQRLALVL